MTQSSPNTKLSVLILTKDEEVNIEECLRCFESFSDDIVILDSLSTDRTIEIARRTVPGVRVITRAFDTEFRQRNFGLHEIQYKHEWVYVCDADERVPADLAAEMIRRVGDPNCPHAAYRVRYRNMYRGRWIKRATGYPVWLLRLVRPSRVRYEERETNVHPLVDGSIGELDAHFIHYTFNSGLVRWFRKHNFYSTREAIEGVKVRRQGMPSWSALTDADPMARRRAMKNWSYFLVGRALWRFLHTYFIRGGILDGAAGFHYCTMIAMYEYWIELKMREIEHPWDVRTTKLAERMLQEPPPKDKSLPHPVPSATQPLVDIMIPTLNESSHIAETVRNARELGNVYVLDSLSTDGTQELARREGATVVERRFTDYADHKNWGIKNLSMTGEWVFILDADERITPALCDEVRRRVASPHAADGYLVNRVLLFMGQPVRHGGLYPSWNLRLFRRGRAWYEQRTVHEHMICAGPTAHTKNEMLHIRRENLSDFLSKHIRYADLESDEWVSWRLGRGGGAPPKFLFRSMLLYRQWLRRQIWPRLPGRPLLRFVYMYVCRLGFMDGTAGWHVALLMACYEYMISQLYAEKLAATTGKHSAPRGKAPALGSLATATGDAVECKGAA